MSKINKRLFSVDEYVRMAEAGILSPTERVELIRGEIVVMSPIGPRHQASVNRGNQTLVHLLRGRTIVQPQGPTELDKFAMPQPDFALLRPQEDFYGRHLPERPRTSSRRFARASSSSRLPDSRGSVPFLSNHPK